MMDKPKQPTPQQIKQIKSDKDKQLNKVVLKSHVTKHSTKYKG